jgi:hypothetical protein
MSDAETQELRRRALGGDDLALERLKSAWLRTHTVENLPKPVDEGIRRGVRVTPIPAMVSRAAKEPLYDRIYLPRNEPVREQFFRVSCGGTCPRTGRQKTLADTNMYSGGCLPAGYEAHFYKVSLIPDAGTPLRDYWTLYNRGLLEFRMGPSRRNSWAARHIMLPPVVLPPSERGVLEIIHPLGGVLDITVGGTPIRMQSLESFDVQLTCDEALTEPMHVMFTFWSVVARAISA